MRRRRQWIAALLVSVLAFAQTVTAAHACTISSPTPPSGVAFAAGAMPSDYCADMAKHAGSSANLCESHCFAGQQVTAQADAPLPPAAPQSPLTVRVVDPFIAVSTFASAPRPVSAARPPLLRFGRFLI